MNKVEKVSYNLLNLTEEEATQEEVYYLWYKIHNNLTAYQEYKENIQHLNFSDVSCQWLFANQPIVAEDWQEIDLNMFIPPYIDLEEIENIGYDILRNEIVKIVKDIILNYHIKKQGVTGEFVERIIKSYMTDLVTNIIDDYSLNFDSILSNLTEYDDKKVYNIILIKK